MKMNNKKSKIIFYEKLLEKFFRERNENWETESFFFCKFTFLKSNQ
jgi:hypothetical protein